LLILECIGCICLETNRVDEARRYLTRAVELPTESYALLRIHALIYASRAAQADRDLTYRYLDEAIDIAQRTTWVPKTVLTQALGERALLTWAVNGVQDAVPALSDTLEALLTCKPEGSEYKEVAVILGNSISYFLQFAGGKTPVGHNHEPLPPPQRGVFLSKNSARLADFDPVRVANMPTAMALLADMTTHDDLVILWAERGARMAEEAARPGSLAGEQIYLSVVMVRRDDYGAAVRMFLATVARTMAGGFSLRDGGHTKLDSDLDVEAVLGSRSSDRWRAVEVVVLQGLVLPAVFRIAEVWLDEPTLGANLAAQLAQECYTVGYASADGALWQKTANIVETSFGEHRSPLALERVVQDSSLDPIIRVIAQVGLSLDDGRGVSDVLGNQLATVEYAQRYCPAFSFRQLVTPFVTRYWLNMAQQQPFRFSPPALSLEEIRTASVEPVPRRAKAVLRAAMFGLGIKDIPQEVRAWLRGP
jgi:hypothetical protein